MTTEAVIDVLLNVYLQRSGLAIAGVALEEEFCLTHTVPVG